MSKNKYLNILWLATPTLIWSVGMHGFTLCIDPLLVQALDRRVHPKLAFFVRLAWATCFMVALLYAWNITPGAYSFYLHEALPFSPVSVMLGLLVACIGLALFAVYTGTRTMSPKLSGGIATAGAIMLALKIMLAITAGPLVNVQQYFRSSVATLARRATDNLLTGADHAVPETPRLTFGVFAVPDAPSAKKVVLMLVESWAEQSEALSKIVAATEAQGFTVVRSGFTTYRGGTLSGEFRELCSTYLMPSDGLSHALGGLDCVPRRMRRLGFETIGLHGYKRSFYARELFWRRLGFDKIMFRDQFTNENLCGGAFDGVCDKDLIWRGIDLLDADARPRFIYMLTLSSHEPLAEELLSRPPQFFSGIDVVHPTQVVARRALSDLLSALKSRRRPECTVVHVVGDHQPRTPLAKGRFDDSKVPYLTFMQNCP